MPETVSVASRRVPEDLARRRWSGAKLAVRQGFVPSAVSQASRAMPEELSNRQARADARNWR